MIQNPYAPRRDPFAGGQQHSYEADPAAQDFGGGGFRQQGMPHGNFPQVGGNLPPAQFQPMLTGGNQSPMQLPPMQPMLPQPNALLGGLAGGASQYGQPGFPFAGSFRGSRYGGF